MILEVTGQPEVREPNVPLLVKEDIRRLQQQRIPVTKGMTENRTSRNAVYNYAQSVFIYTLTTLLPKQKMYSEFHITLNSVQ